MSRYVLAIDQGTTGSKALVLGEDGRIAGSASGEFRQYYPRPGWVEHDPEEIWHNVVSVTEAALADAGARPGEITALGITNQRETTVLWERSTGRPVHRAVVWQDRRTAAMCQRLAEDGAEQLIRDRTGLLLDAYFSGTKIAWLLDNVDGLRRRAEDGEIVFGTVDSWLVHRLTDGQVHATDATNASRTLLMDLDRVEWDQELCGLLGVPPQMLPAIEPSAHVYGETDPDQFVGLEVPIAGILGDQQSALFAQGCFSAGEIKNTYGTGSFVLQHTGDQPHTGQRELIATVASQRRDGHTEYALEGSIFVTGAAVQWLRDGLGIIQNAEETEELAASLDGNDDVWLVPALVGLGAPSWDPYARGTLLGATRGTTRAHLARAALESMAYQTRDVIEVMSRESGGPPDELRVDGGASVNRWLMQFQADILGTPVDVAEVIETTSLGSAYAAGLVVDVFTDRDQLRQMRRRRDYFEPRMADDQRETLYARWRQAVDRARQWAREEG
jgi:glycerol kinase